jgi:cation diffusion facilitator family transporter
MHRKSIEPWRHEHFFLGARHARNERRIWFVVALTAAMMVAEIAGGLLYGSMALLADGWHMSTHAGALTIAGLAYRFAKRHAHDPRFSFGTGKLGELTAFASAIILAVIALAIAYESVVRLVNPVAISFEQAIVIAVIGLAVNLISAWALFDADDHHEHPHAHDEGHSHRAAYDYNIRAAFMHVLADAMTSVTAIVGLLAGLFYGWIWMDAIMGIVGAMVISHWSLGLIRSTGAVLLDVVPDPKLARLVRDRLEVDGDRIADLHLWRLGPGHVALIAVIVSDRPKPPDAYRARLAAIGSLSHMTFEVHRCDENPRKAA